MSGRNLNLPPAQPREVWNEAVRRAKSCRSKYGSIVPNNHIDLFNAGVDTVVDELVEARDASLQENKIDG